VLISSCDTILDSESVSKPDIETIHLDIGDGDYFPMNRFQQEAISRRKGEVSTRFETTPR